MVLLYPIFLNDKLLTVLYMYVYIFVQYSVMMLAHCSMFNQYLRTAGQINAMQWRPLVECMKTPVTSHRTIWVIHYCMFFQKRKMFGSVICLLKVLSLLHDVTNPLSMT